MNAFLPFAELREGDLFVSDHFYTGGLSKVLAPPKRVGDLVEIECRDLVDGAVRSHTFNAEHITKYLRFGETDPRLNIGRG